MASERGLGSRLFGDSGVGVGFRAHDLTFMI